MKSIEDAMNYALNCHNSTNHKYDGHGYDFHLDKVVAEAERFKDLVSTSDYPFVIAACWCHDVIEDTRQTYNDVKNATSKTVAEIVYALTNEKGKNRKERANSKYYEGIRNTPLARFVKICDRLANVRYAFEQRSRMLEAYRAENEEFKKELFCEEYKEMFKMLDYFVS